MNDDYIDNKWRRRIKVLDQEYPANLPNSDMLWQKIVARKESKQARIKWIWQIAASFTLILMASVIWELSNTEKRTQHFVLNTELISAEEREAIEYINKFCRSNNISCDSPAFKELHYELTASTSTLKEINKKIALFGEDTNLLKAQSRIKNHQARIIKAMIQTL